MKYFQNQIRHVCNDDLASVTIYINWKLIVDVDFGAKHFCSPKDAESRYAQKWQKLSFAKLSLIVPQKCFVPKSTSTISFLLIHRATGAKLSLEECIF